MTLRSFLVLAGATAFAVVLAVSSTLTFRTDNAVSERGKAFLPGLAARIGDVATITVQDGAQTVTLKRKGESFEDASGFPTKMKPVRDLALSLSTLRIEERKTADVSRHADLALAAPSAKMGAGKSVVLKSKEGEMIASVLVGKPDYTVGGVGGGQYVRMTDSQQTYLVRGNVKLPYGRSGWFETKLYEIEGKTISRLTISKTDKERVVLERSGSKLALSNVPTGLKPDDSNITRLRGLVESLEFADVRSKRTSDKKPGPVITVSTSDGLQLAIASIDQSKDGARWVKVSARAAKGSAKKRAADLNAKLSAFEFKLNNYNSKVFSWSLQDLTKKAES